MNMLNSVIVEGDVVEQPEIKSTPNGVSVCTITIAVSRECRNANGERASEVSYFDVDAFGNIADVCAKMCLKGRGMRVVGRLRQVRWDDGDGKAHSKVNVVAEHIEFKFKGKEANNG